MVKYCTNAQSTYFPQLMVALAFFSLARIWGECPTIHSLLAVFLSFFSPEVISSRALVYSLWQDQSTVVRAEMSS